MTRIFNCTPSWNSKEVPGGFWTNFDSDIKRVVQID